MARAKVKKVKVRLLEGSTRIGDEFRVEGDEFEVAEEVLKGPLSDILLNLDNPQPVPEKKEEKKESQEPEGKEEISEESLEEVGKGSNLDDEMTE